MKVVINRYYGGFSLSHQAVMLYGKKKGIELYPATCPNLSDDFFVPYTGQNVLTIHYSTKPLLDDKIQEDSYFNDRDINRSDPILVEVVEELGEKANGSCALLGVIEIPDGVSWHVEEYDGMEHIAEDHRTWN